MYILYVINVRHGLHHIIICLAFLLNKYQFVGYFLFFRHFVKFFTESLLQLQANPYLCIR